MSEINQNAGDNSNQIGSINKARDIYIDCILHQGDLDDSTLRRLGVLFFLISVFLFSSFMGGINLIPFINIGFISFPFAETRNLIKCFWGGSFEKKINHYAQGKLQRKKIKKNAGRNKENIKNLDREAYLYWLCIEIINKLGFGDFEGHRRIFETIDFLEQKKVETLEKLPRKSKIFFDFDQTDNYTTEYAKVNKIINKIYRNAENNPDIKYEDILKQVNKEIESNYKKISPFVLKTLYTTRKLIHKSVTSDITNKAENKYIWDVKSKIYHYSKDCQHWKALMYDYLISYDAQREIIIRENEDDIHRESELRDKQIKLWYRLNK